MYNSKFNERASLKVLNSNCSTIYFNSFNCWEAELCVENSNWRFLVHIHHPHSKLLYMMLLYLHFYVINIQPFYVMIDRITKRIVRDSLTRNDGL
jgi:hypothetical protein